MPPCRHACMHTCAHERIALQAAKNSDSNNGMNMRPVVEPPVDVATGGSRRAQLAALPSTGIKWRSERNADSCLNWRRSSLLSQWQHRVCASSTGPWPTWTSSWWIQDPLCERPGARTFFNMYLERLAQRIDLFHSRGLDIQSRTAEVTDGDCSACTLCFTCSGTIPLATSLLHPSFVNVMHACPVAMVPQLETLLPVPPSLSTWPIQDACLLLAWSFWRACRDLVADCCFCAIDAECASQKTNVLDQTLLAMAPRKRPVSKSMTTLLALTHRVW